MVKLRRAAQSPKNLPELASKKAPTRSLTLGQALETIAKPRWRGMRSYACLVSSAETAIRALGGKGVSVQEVTCEDLTSLVRDWSPLVSAATIHHRLSCLNVLGVTTRGVWPRQNIRRLKWWLDKETQRRLLELPCEPHEARNHVVLCLYAAWAVETGLRVEESLRLCRSHFMEDFSLLKVPGTKTAQSLRTIPLSAEARALAELAFRGRLDADAPMFTLGYLPLRIAWVRARSKLGITDPTATLKAFRRGAAHRLHVEKGLPLILARDYLGHQDVTTTEGYLRITGSRVEDMRRFLR